MSYKPNPFTGQLDLDVGDFPSFKSLRVTNATTSTSTTTGALVVFGGLGVAGAINAGGAIKGDSLEVASGILSYGVYNSFGYNQSSQINIALSNNSESERKLYFATNGEQRWAFVVGVSAESGSDSGSVFTLTSFRDNGASENVLLATRVPGSQVTLSRPLLVNGALTAQKLQLSALNTAPASASDTGTAGEIRIDADYIYVCTATNTWKRTALTTW